MAEQLTINVEISSDYKSITVTDQTDWTAVTGTIDSLTSIVLSFYTTTTESAEYTYTFTGDDLTEYTANETISFTFETLFTREFAIDNWYDVKMVANDGDYESNFAGFGSDAYITNAVYVDNLNDLHTPEKYKGDIEPLLMQKMWLDGMKYLGTSTLTDRSIKWKARFNALSRINS